MKRRSTLLIASLAMAAAMPVAHSEILDDWQFNDSEGTVLANTLNEGTGGDWFASVWGESIGESATTGDGVFRVHRSPATTGTAYAEVNYTLPDTFWLVVDFDGWAYSLNEGNRNEEIRFGFWYGANQFQYAEIRMRRLAPPDKVHVRGEAQSRGNGATLIDNFPTGLSNEEDRPVRFVLKVDRSNPDDQTYSIFYNIDNEGYVHAGDGALDPDRDPTYLGLRFVNDFSHQMDPDDPDAGQEFVDVDRLFITTTDPVDDIIPGPEISPPEEKMRENWSFNDPDGTPLSETVNSVGDAQWTEDIGDSFTTGDGTFRIQRSTGTVFDSYAYIDREWAGGKQWFVADIGGWYFNTEEGTPIEIFQVGFVDDEGPGTTAQVRLRRFDDEEMDPNAVYLGGRAAGGYGSSNLDDEPLFTTEQTEPVRLVVEYDGDERTYKVFYRVGGGDYILFGEGPTSDIRNSNAIHMRAINDFSNPGEYFDVDRVFYTTADPMVPVEGGYAEWADVHFPGGGPESETGADPDGDGVSNLLEYAFGGNPNVADRSVVPTVQSGESHLEIRFTRNTDADDLTYTVLASPDLDNWTPIASAAPGEPFTASGASNIEVEGDLVTVSDSEPISSERRFLRVEVEASNP